MAVTADHSTSPHPHTGNPQHTGAGRAWIALLFGQIGLTVGYALLWVPRDNPPSYLAAFGASFVLFLAAVLAARPTLERLDVRQIAVVLVLTGACLRVAAAMGPSSLSDDVFRYVWDGQVLLEGGNPYRELPGVLVNRAEMSTELFGRLNSPKFYSVYAPASQIVFGAGSGLAEWLGLPPDRLIRLLLGLLDLIAIAALVRALQAFGRSPGVAALYAWNPLVYWELVGGGHSEAVMLPALGLAVWAAAKDRWLVTGLAVGLAVLAKTTALLVAPILLWHVMRRVGFARALFAAVATAATLAAGYAPFWFDGLVPNLRQSWGLYFGHFIFNSPIYEVMRQVLGYQEGVTPDVADQILPWFSAIVVATVVLASVVGNGRNHRLAAALMAPWLAHLLLSPVFHPWYLVPVLYLAVMTRAGSPLVLSALVPVSYLAYDSQRAVSQWTLMGIWLGPFLVALGVDLARAGLEPILRWRGRRKFRAFAEHLPDNARLLDIGSGEGFVALEAARHGHEPVLMDIVDRNRTDLPFVQYDGVSFPFAGGSLERGPLERGPSEGERFDVGVLAYVLHHCSEPDDVLREASRVCRRLIVMESVYESDWDRRLLTFLDHWANRTRGIPVEPLRFDRVEGWRRRFAELGLRPIDEKWLGRVVHKHVLFVLDSPPAPATTGSGREVEPGSDRLWRAPRE